MIFCNIAAGRAVLVTALAATLLAGCATSPGSDKPEAVVKERAHARWQALMKGDFETAYKMTSPSYRAVFDLPRYRARFGAAASWTGAEIYSVKCEPEKCQVVMEIEARPLLRGSMREPVSTAVEETWVKEGGQWWLYQRM